MIPAGLRLRLCPFCGSEAELYRSGVVSVVRCMCCGSEGPTGVITDFVDYGDDIPEQWEKAQTLADGAAVRGWNGRPLYGSMFPDELERFEKESEIYWDESEL